MSGKTYKNAVKFQDRGNVFNGNKKSSAYFNLGETYTTVSGVCGTVDDSVSDTGASAELYFYGDGILLKTYTVTAGQIVTNFTVNVTGDSQLTITCENGDKSMNAG
ncbi:MAG: NPCBM/NEW2 domain-containing protein [Clostridiales bacterium]|nr:NPCBM/NEW2 domain-containing protein [Clostridiales bacterium]